MKPLTTEQRSIMYGRFAYKATPTKDNPERIQVTDAEWLKKLVKINLPVELASVEGVDVATFHELVLPRFEKLIASWRKKDLLGDIIQWSGSYAPRFIRGRPGVLSAHAFGSAFDINAGYNGLGKKPAAAGTKGSVLRLVPIAEEQGWIWGGRWQRPDGMHFELGSI
jgi:hypothetical protein